MKTFEITGPDGKKYRVKGETAEGAVAALKQHRSGKQEATYEELMNMARKAHNAGEPDHARRLVQMAKEAKGQPQANMSLMGRVKDNVIGVDDGVESVGEKIGTGIRGATAAVARGMADVPALPVNLAQLGALGVEKATGMEGPSAVSRALGKLPDTRDMLSAIPVIGPESEFQVPGLLGKYISTAGEFAGGAGVAAGPSKMIRYGAIPGTASEWAGQNTEVTAVEPYARAGAAIGASILATPQPQRFGRGLLSVDDEAKESANYLSQRGIQPTAGQVVDSHRMMKLEGSLGTLDHQQEALTRAALKLAGNTTAKRATPANLNKTQNAITRGMNTILDFDAPIPANAASPKRKESVRRALRSRKTWF